MQLVIDANAVVSKPAKSQTGNTGYFQPGDIPTNAPATRVTAEVLNTIISEISHVITDPAGGNTALNVADDGQLLTAIQHMIADAVGAVQAVPVATVFYRAQASVPVGYLLADGSAVSRTTYSALFSAIGTLYGAGNGSTTFNLPDLRGVFARGVDLGRGLDPGRAFGTKQKGTLFGYNIRDDGPVYGTSVNGTADGPLSQSMIGVDDYTVADYAGVRIAGASGMSHYSLPGTTGTGWTGVTRPHNVALYPIIKT